MIVIKKKKDCTGCSACFNICPVNAIVMTADEEGFFYPMVNETKCIRCNKCVNICPVMNFDISQISAQKLCIYKKAFAFKNLDDSIRNVSSSGGAFFALAASFIESGGIVAGAAFNEEFQVHHIIAHSKEELKQLIGSKYVQSSTGTLYQEIQELLTRGTNVFFVGMTCQVEALSAFLGKEYSNLYCLDLICMGIPSPGIWDKYLSTYFNREHIQSINFKDKSQGWHKFSFAVKYKDGSQFLQTGQDNYYMQSMFKGYSMRPACFSCNFKNEIKRADITIADCWGSERYLPEMDDNLGLSMLIVHSEKGMELVEALKKDVLIKEFSYSHVLKENPNYHNCAKPNKYRTLFIQLMQKLNPKIAFFIMCRNPHKSILSRIKRKLTN